MVGDTMKYKMFFCILSLIISFSLTSNGKERGNDGVIVGVLDSSYKIRYFIFEDIQSSKNLHQHLSKKGLLNIDHSSIGDRCPAATLQFFKKDKTGLHYTDLACLYLSPKNLPPKYFVSYDEYCMLIKCLDWSWTDGFNPCWKPAPHKKKVSNPKQ